jgi:hypothetical protein
MNRLPDKMKRSLPAVSLALAVAAFAGCSTTPTYVPAAGEVLVPLRFMGMGKPQVCRAGQALALETDARGVARVPAGQRITVGAYIYVDNYNRNFDCSPWISFVPQPQSGYVAHAGLGESQRCFVELVREDAARETGVALEPTFRPDACRPPPP